MFVNKKFLEESINSLRSKLDSNINDLIACSERERTVTDACIQKVSDQIKLNKDHNDSAVEYLVKTHSEFEEQARQRINLLKSEINATLEAYKNDFNLLKREVEIITKIVCHMSGAKEPGEQRNHFFDEILRRLAKLEGREDTENG